MPPLLTERERIERTLRGETCDKIPWATRLDIWHTAATRSGKMPEEFAGMDLMEIHHQLGIACQSYALVTRMRLHGVDVKVEFNGEIIHTERSPDMNFPVPREYVPKEKPGDTRITFATPEGQAQIRFRTTETSIREAEMPYLMDHILKDNDDYKVVKWILNHAEQVAAFKGFERSEKGIGDYGFTIPMIGRIPFQQIMLDYMGEEHTIYTLMDDKRRINYLLDALGDQVRRSLEMAMVLPSFIVEFGDNFEGMVTSPSFFLKYCIPFLQESSDRLHAKGKRLASHMDGNLKPLVHLIPDSGVDVVESFSPAPLTALTFREAWEIWREKVLMWGVIPSPIFEPQTSEQYFEGWLREMFDILSGDQRIILGIGDQAIGPTLLGRIRQVSEILGRKPGIGGRYRP